MVGFTNINFRNNKIAAGSIFEYLGNLIKVTADEDVTSITSMNNDLFYIYAYFNANNAVAFRASTDKPDWFDNRNGYYKLVDGKYQRAIIKAVRNVSDNSITGVQMNNILNNVTSVTPPNSGGTQVYTKNVRAHEVTHQNPGWYRFEIKSGLGNGAGANYSGYTGGAGGIASTYNSISGVFYHFGGTILVHVGGNGFNGGGGGNGASLTNPTVVTYLISGGGGGSGAGEESYIISGSQIYKTERIKSGNGGSGNGGAGGHGSLDEVSVSNFVSLNGNGGNGDNYNSTGNGGIGGAGGGQGGRGDGGGSLTSYTPPGRGGSGVFGYGAGGGGASAQLLQEDGINKFIAGAGGGGGGAPGWNRSLGDGAAGYVTIWFLGQ